MFNNIPDISVEEEFISDEEWAVLIQHANVASQPFFNEKRTREPPIPADYRTLLTPLQLATITNLEGFGWELMFIRRSNPKETITMLHFPNSGETALIERDGTVNHAHKVYIRPSKSDN